MREDEKLPCPDCQSQAVDIVESKDIEDVVQRKYKAKAFNHDDTGRAHYAIVQVIQDRTGKSVFTSASADDICPICNI